MEEKTTNWRQAAALAEAMNRALVGPGRPPAVTAIEEDDALQTPPGAAPELGALRERQRTALGALLSGRNHTEAAHLAGVDRKTLYNWMKKDAAFAEAMAAWKLRAARSVQDRLIQAAEAAATTLTAAATKDFRAAAILLRGCGMLGAKADRVADSPLARIELLPPNQRRAFEIRLRELILSFGKEPSASQVPEPVITSTGLSVPALTEAEVK